MLRKEYFGAAWILPFLALSLGMSGCSDETGPEFDDGFIAGDGDFSGFNNWDLVDYTVFPVSEALLGNAHAGNNPNVARMIYQNQTAALEDGKYKRGSILVKETFQWSGDAKQPTAEGAFLGMTKRNGDFNSDHGGWEYFNLGADGNAIAGRGSDLMDGMCQGCHTAADGNAGMDYIFTHPAEYAVPDGGEWDIFGSAVGNWELIASNTGPHPFLGGSHGANDTLTRDTYRWQPAARFANDRFPVGTVLMKEVYRMEGENKVYVNNGDGAFTGMVKRGGDFNPSNGGWEWFMINPITRTVGRGAELMNNMCNSCHSQAGSGSDRGGDMVFHHPGIGFE